MKKIDIDGIDKYAFVPQCLDNQFIPLRLSDCFDPSSKKHQQIKLEETRKELVRGLIYSSQILVNRVAFFNNDVLLNLYSNQSDKNALVNLFNNKRIVPALYKEESFTRQEIESKNNFTLNPRIEDFFSFLENELRDSNLEYVVISSEKEVSDKLSSFFDGFFGYLGVISLDNVTDIVKEISPRNLDNRSYIESFRAHLYQVADDFTKHARIAGDTGKPFTREDYYRLWVVEDESRPVDMYIASEKKFSVETKHLLDLAYNYNFAKAYEKNILCPEGMPTPLAIPASLRASTYRSSNEEEFKESVKREELIYRTTQRFSIPDTSKLTLSQIVTIQGTEQWQNYIKFQRELFNNPSSWGPKVIDEYARVLGELYLKIKTDYSDFPYYENVFFGVHIVVKFSHGVSQYVSSENVGKVLEAIDLMMEAAEARKDQTIQGLIKVKQFVFDEKENIIEEFATGMSEIELSEVDLMTLKDNYRAVDLSMKSDSENNALR